MKADDLKPCPFCGNTAIRVIDMPRHGTCMIACSDCGGRGPSRQRRRDALDAWNRRAEVNDD